MNQNRQTQLITSLGFAGLLPFIFTAVLTYLDQSLFDLAGALWFSYYSAVILAFLSGSLWGLLLGKQASALSLCLLVFSNGIALVVWMALGLAEYSLFGCLLLLSAGYLAVLGVELATKNILYQGVSQGYPALRLVLSAVVVALHFLVTVLLVND